MNFKINWMAPADMTEIILQMKTFKLLIYSFGRKLTIQFVMKREKGNPIFPLSV